MTAPYSLELLVATPLLDGLDEHVCSRGAESPAGSRYPSVRFRWNDILWDSQGAWPHDERLSRRLADVLEWEGERLVEELKAHARAYWPFEVLFDEYDVCAKVDLCGLWASRAEYVSEIERLLIATQDGRTAANIANRLSDWYERIEGVDKALVGLAQPLQEFKEMVEGFRSWFDGWSIMEHVDDDGEREYDFVEGDRPEWDDGYVGWVRYDWECDAAPAKGAREMVCEAVQAAVRRWSGLRRIRADGWTRALNSLLEEVDVCTGRGR